MKEKKKLSLAAQIFIALVLAVIAGLLMQKYANFAETYIKPFGTIFLNLLKFIVVPIVLFSIMCGIISMKDIKKVGSIGAKTVVYYMCTTAFAITFGLIGANMFKGAFPKIATTDLSYKADQTISLMDTIVNIFPSNFVSPMVEANMLQVIVTALILGFGIILLGEGERNTRLVTACNDLNDVFMKCMEMILKLSPIGGVLSAESGHCFKRAGDHRFTRDGTSDCLCMLHHPCSSCIFVCSKDNGRNEPVKILQGNASGNHVRILKFFICRNTSD